MPPPSGMTSMPRPAGAASTSASTSAALSLILHCSKHTHADPGWDAAGLDHVTLLDLILASKDLGNRGMFDLAYNTVAAMVDRKSSDEIRAHQTRRRRHSSAQMAPKLEKALLAVRYFTRDGVAAIWKWLV